MALLHCGDRGGPGASTSARSDRHGEFVERDRHPPPRWLLDSQLVLIMSAPNVLYQRMPHDDHPGAVILLEAPHRSEPRLQPPVICLNPVIAILLGAVPRRRQQLIQDGQIRRRLVGGALHRRDLCRADGLLKEPASRHGVSVCADEYVDDLAELVDRSVDIPPAASHLHIGLVDLPAIADAVAAWPRGVGQQWREPLHPAVDGDVVDLDAALGEEFFDVALGQAEAQLPADRNDDDIGWEAEAGERGARRDPLARWASSSHGGVSTPGPPHGQRNRALPGQFSKQPCPRCRSSGTVGASGGSAVAGRPCLGSEPAFEGGRCDLRIRPWEEGLAGQLDPEPAAPAWDQP